MIIAVYLCTSILSPHSGCTVERVFLVEQNILPTTCVMKAQEVLAEKMILWGGATIARFGCERRKAVAHG